MESVSIAPSRRTLCDDIVIITASDSPLPHELLTRFASKPLLQHVTESDGLVERSIAALEMLWQILLGNEEV